MTFSYADAMRGNRPAEPENRQSPPPPPPAAAAATASRNVSVSYPQLPVISPSNTTSQRPPSKMVWGKQQAIPSQARVTNNVNNPQQILRKNSQTDGVSPSPQPNATVTAVPVASRPKVPPTSAQKVERKTANQPNKSKKPKPKPQLKSMSIGDVIGISGKKQTGQLKRAPLPSFHTRLPQVASTQEFPALSAPSTNPKPNPALRKAWGAEPRKPAAALTASPQDLKGGEQPKVAANPKKNPPSKQHTKRPAVPSVATGKNSTHKLSASVAAAFFRPTADLEGRVGDGDEHKLLRLMQDRNISQKKGRQRLAPRKKKFTALKKKVLHERLRKYRDLHPENAPTAGTKADGSAVVDSLMKISGAADDVDARNSCSVCVYGFTQPDELEDDDEYNEILANLREMAEKIGQTKDIYIPKKLDRQQKYPVFVKFLTSHDAVAAKVCWNGLKIGGESLEAFQVDDSSSHIEAGGTWAEAVVAAESSRLNNCIVTQNGNMLSTTIVLQNVLTEDDFEDEECLKESMDDIQGMLQSHGKVLELRSNREDNGSVEVVIECRRDTAETIVEKLRQVLLGGVAVSALIADENKSEAMSPSTSTVVILENALTEDDLQDKDCLEESLYDIRELAQKHGTVSSIQAEGELVHITYEEGPDVARRAVNAMSGLCLGGSTISARLNDTRESDEDTGAQDGFCIYLQNLLTVDDLEDEDCLEESLNDARELAAQFGDVVSLDVIKDDRVGVLKIQYSGPRTVAESAAQGFSGMTIGGQIVSALMHPPGEGSVGNSSVSETKNNHASESESSGDKRLPTSKNEAAVAKKARTDDRQPIYSGDKLISERFAECKRVPKVPNSGEPRDYANLATDERVKPLLIEMLGELMRLQKRATEDKNAKARRRIVMGLREVARGIRAHKVKMVVMANNMDEYGAIDAKLQEIIDLARSEDVPLFFEFTKRSLGKALGKSIKVAVVGIQTADGAHQPFKKLISLASNI
jgi:ribosomal protein L7Ae-like RNA K-turn-binding protein